MLAKKVFPKLLQVFFHLLYHQFAWAYDFVANMVSLGSWQKWVYTIRPYLHHEQILEIGFGPGHLQNELAKTGFRQVYGIDASFQMARQAQKRITKAGISHRLAQSFSQALPFPAHSFRQVVSTFPTEYALDPRTIREVHRVLTAKGEWLILPGVNITGKQAKYKALKWLFDITHQTPGNLPDCFSRYREAGFDVKLIPIRTPNWKCEIICCTIRGKAE